MFFLSLFFIFLFFFSSRRRHTRCALVTGVQTCALVVARPRPEAPPVTTAEIDESSFMERSNTGCKLQAGNGPHQPLRLFPRFGRRNVPIGKRMVVMPCRGELDQGKQNGRAHV